MSEMPDTADERDKLRETVQRLLNNPKGSFLFTNNELVVAWMASDLIEQQISTWDLEIELKIEAGLAFRDNAEVQEIVAKKRRATALLRDVKPTSSTQKVFHFRNVMIRKDRDWRDKDLIFIDALSEEIGRGAELKRGLNSWSLWITHRVDLRGFITKNRLLIGNAFTEAQAVHAGCRWVAEEVMVDPMWVPGTQPTRAVTVKDVMVGVDKQNKGSTTTKYPLSTVTSPATVPSMPSPERKHFIKS